MGRADPLFHFRLTPALLDLLRLPAAERRAWVEKSGLPEDALGGPCTAPLSAVRTLFELAAAHAGEDVGLRLAQAVPEGTYDTAELLVRTAPSVRSGLAALSRYAALINPVGRFEVRAARGRVELHYFVSGLGDGLGPHLNEYTLGYIVGSIRRHAGPTPIDAWLPQGRRRGLARLEAHLGCAVRPRAGTLGFAIAAEAAERPLASADPVVFRYLERQAEERLRLLGDRSFAATVAEVIESTVGLAAADLERVAKVMASTARTVQRRLDDEGTSFRGVLDQLRQRHADRMEESGLAPGRIAEVLGFSDLRSYRRAKQRWNRGSARGA
jgi:AraC-like DNA-binding protein